MYLNFHQFKGLGKVINVLCVVAAIVALVALLAAYWQVALGFAALGFFFFLLRL